MINSQGSFDGFNSQGLLSQGLRHSQRGSFSQCNNAFALTQLSQSRLHFSQQSLSEFVEKVVGEVQVRDGMSAKALSELKKILSNEDCLNVFLLFHSKNILPVIIGGISRISPAEYIKLTCIYSIMTACCIPERAMQHGQVCSGGDAQHDLLDHDHMLIYVENVKRITTDVIRLLKDSQQDVLTEAILGFLEKFFLNGLTLKQTFYSSNGLALLALFRRILSGSSPKVQKLAISALISLMKTYNFITPLSQGLIEPMSQSMSQILMQLSFSASQNLSQSQGQSDPAEDPIIVALMKSDIHYYVAKCFSCQDATVFNLAAKFLEMMGKVSSLAQTRMVGIIDDAIRVFGSLVENDDLDRETTLSFISSVLSKAPEVDLDVQEQLVYVFVKISGSTKWKPEEALTASKLLLFCKDESLIPALKKVVVEFLCLTSGINYLTHIKLILVTCQALSQCIASAVLDEDEVSPSNEEGMMWAMCFKALSSTRYTVLLFGLLKSMNPQDVVYIEPILKILEQCPLDELKIQTRRPVPSIFMKLQIESDSVQSFEMEVTGIHEEDNGPSPWNSETFIEMLFLILENPDLMGIEEICGNVQGLLSRILVFSSVSLVEGRLPIFDKDGNLRSSNHLTIFPAECIKQLPAIPSEAMFDIKHAKELLQSFWFLGLKLGFGNGTKFCDWFNVLNQDMFRFLPDVQECKIFKCQQDTVLMTYFTYYSFAPNASTTILSSEFFNALNNFLSFVTSHKENFVSFMDHYRFYIKASFLLVSCGWMDSRSNGDVKRKIVRSIEGELKTCMPESSDSDFEQLMNMIPDRLCIIPVLSSMESLPTATFRKIFEQLIEKSFDDFEHFIRTWREEENTHARLHVIRDAITGIVADGELELSCRVLELWKQKKEAENFKLFLGFDEGFVYETLFELTSNIRNILDEKFISSLDEQTTMGTNQYEDTLERRLENLCNLIVVARGLPCSSEVIVPPDFYVNLMTLIRTQYRHPSNIGYLGLQHLMTLIKKKVGYSSPVPKILGDNDFLQFLEKVLKFEKMQSDIVYLGYELMSHLVEISMLSHYRLLTGTGFVEWRLATIIPYLPYTSTGVDHLSFLNRLLECKFNCPFVKVHERNGQFSTKHFTLIFNNVMFGLENLLLKVLGPRESDSHIWITMTKMLTFVRVELEELSSVDNLTMYKTTFCSLRLMTSIEMVLKSTDPHCNTLIIECLEFIRTWIQGLIYLVQVYSSRGLNCSDLYSRILETLCYRVRDWTKNNLGKKMHPWFINAVGVHEDRVDVLQNIVLEVNALLDLLNQMRTSLAPKVKAQQGPSNDKGDGSGSGPSPKKSSKRRHHHHHHHREERSPTVPKNHHPGHVREGACARHSEHRASSYL